MTDIPDPYDRAVSSQILVCPLAVAEMLASGGEELLNRPWPPDGDDPGVPFENRERLAAVVVGAGESLAAIAVVIDVATGVPVWENLANGEDSTVRFVAAAVLLCDTMRIQHG